MVVDIYSFGDSCFDQLIDRRFFTDLLHVYRRLLLQCQRINIGRVWIKSMDGVVTVLCGCWRLFLPQVPDGTDNLGCGDVVSVVCNQSKYEDAILSKVVRDELP